MQFTKLFDTGYIDLLKFSSKTKREVAVAPASLPCCTDDGLCLSIRM